MHLIAWNHFGNDLFTASTPSSVPDRKEQTVGCKSLSASEFQDPSLEGSEGHPIENIWGALRIDLFIILFIHCAFLL